MSTKVCGEEYRTIHICVDGFQGGVLSGRLFNRSLPAGIPFHCLSQLLEEVARILDGMDYPKSFTAPRTFGPKRSPEPAPPPDDFQAGRLATFSLRILFRQNASWQGSVAWLEGKQEQSFRSALELIFLVNSALEYREAS